MKKKGIHKWFGVIMAVALVLGLAACSGSNEGANNTSAPDNKGTGNQTAGEAEDYTFGEGQTFHSNEPVTYSMMYSDHENYPYNENWRFWSAVKERTNVDFDLSITARTEYENQKSLLVNSGDAPYIIPKTYEESAYVAGGQIVPISDWVQYMPNYMKAVNDWGLEEDLKAKLQADGKYYALPGLWEVSGGGYSYIIRKDIFEAAGIDVEAEEGKWTYEDFYAALKKVQEFTGKNNIFSDQFKGESTLNIAGVVYGVTGGWGKANGMKFDHDKQQFYFADASEDFKAYVTYFNKLINEKIMDPESFTQDDDVAKAKLFKGDTYVMNGNYQLMADYQTKMEDPNAELYMIVQPGGPKGMLQMETSRLENGIMISQNALDDLGEEEFIKMLRFVDWLWYSDEGQTLSLWGVEGETYTKDAEGNFVLNPEITFNGMNPTATKKLNADFGFGNGMFAYGGSSKLKLSKMTEGERAYNDRIFATRDVRKLDPPIMATTDQSEQLNLIQTPLMDYISTMTLKFITGQEPLSNWDTYTATVEANGSSRYEQLANEVFESTKSKLGY